MILFFLFYQTVAHAQEVNSDVRKCIELRVKGKWPEQLGIRSSLPPATCQIIQLVKIGAVRPH